MRKIDEENTLTQRNRIIRAATQCLNEQGVVKASITNICRAAGMRPGHVYYYYDSKDAILHAVATQIESEIKESIEHMFDGPDIPTQIMDVHFKANMLRGQLGMTPTVRVELAAYFSRMPDGEDLTYNSNEALFTVTQKAIDSAVIAGRLPQGIDVDSLREAIILIWQGLSLSSIYPLFTRHQAEKAVRLMLNGCGIIS